VAIPSQLQKSSIPCSFKGILHQQTHYGYPVRFISVAILLGDVGDEREAASGTGPRYRSCRIVSISRLLPGGTLITYMQFSYGLVGVRHLLRELLDMFPVSTLELPPHISWRTFVEFVLVPEVACLLISEDMSICLEEAVGVWKASRDFGIQAFPDDELDKHHLDNRPDVP